MNDKRFQQITVFGVFDFEKTFLEENIKLNSSLINVY